MQLSDHFSLEEFMRPKLPEDYPAALVDSNLRPLVDRDEWLRALATPSYAIVDSAWRSAAHNAAIGGAPDSQHLDGDANDLYFPLVSLRTLATRIVAAVQAGDAPSFGQIIVYRDQGHVHLSNPAAKLGARNGELLYSPGVDATTGTRIYLPLVDAVANDDVPVLSEPQTREGLLSSSGHSLPFFSSGSSSPARGGTNG